MSATSFSVADVLTFRGRRTTTRGTPAGVKATVKKLNSRAQRRIAGQELGQELRDLVSPQALRNASSDDLDDLATYWLTEMDFDAQGNPLSVEEDDSNEGSIMQLLADEPQGLPSHLVGALPDWMLSRMEEANGSSFELLSLFEAKCPSPKAAICLEDEADVLFA